MMDSSTSQDAEKKSAFDGLDRDELIKKCKGLLLIAQKAKKAKDDLATETTALKERLIECDTQKQADKECLKTMQLMVDSLTEHKLAATNKIVDLERNVKNLTQKLTELHSKSDSLAALEIENEAQSKQIKRLTEENEEQEMDLKKLDEKFKRVSQLSQRQAQELLLLEESVDKWKAMEKFYRELEHQNEALQQQLVATTAEMEFALKNSEKNEGEVIALKLQMEKNLWLCELEMVKKAAVNDSERFESAREQLIHENEELKMQSEKNLLLYEEAQQQIEAINEKLETMKKEAKTNDDSSDGEKFESPKEQLLVIENRELKMQFDEQSVKLSKYKSKLIEFSAKLKHLKHSKQLLLETVSEYSNSVTKWQCDISHASIQLMKEVKQLNETNKLIAKQLEASQYSERELMQSNRVLATQIEENKKSVGDSNKMKEKYQQLSADYKALQSEIQSKNEEVSKVSKEWEQITHNLRLKNDALQVDIGQLKDEIESKRQTVAELEENEELAAKKNNDLLMEMRELNDALKNRGNVISKQTVELNDLHLKYQEQCNRMDELEENLKEKTRLIEQLRLQFDNQSEILSTSTISRAEEVTRMRDIEDSFEEKYNKLRALAIKLKKKVAEQQSIIVKLESSAPSTATPQSSGSIAVTVDANNIKIQNLKTLQAENDQLMDKVEGMKSEQKQLNAEIKELNEKLRKYEDELKSLRIINEDIKATVETNYKTKCALDEVIKNGEKQIEALKSENRVVIQQRKDAENDLLKIKELVKQKENEIALKAEETSKLKYELSKLQASMKKNNVLNLEVDAYEKSLKEMAQKLDTNVKLLTQMENENKSSETTIQLLTIDVKTLKESLESEKQHSIELQHEIDMQKIKLKENNQEIVELKAIIDDHVKESNTIKIELTNLQSQQADTEVEKHKIITNLKKDNEKNVAQLFSLEDEVRELKTKLSSCEQELVNVQTDFASYKVRAQSVLRQNQSKDSTAEEELKEELALLVQTKDELLAKLAHSAEQQRHFQNTIEELQREKQNLHERCKKVLELLDETRQQMESVQSEGRKQSQEHQEALKMHRLQLDTLNNCYKKQIDDMQKKYDDEIVALKSKIRMQASSDAGASTTTDGIKKMPLTNEQRIEMILTERQAGEGSENTESLHGLGQRKISTSRGKRGLIPLDELLNNSFEEEIEPTEIKELHAEVIKEKLAVQQSRVKHLAALLSEAELDVARLTELNDVLKEELRRQERSTEREMHMHNLEYMKNVIFKFLTINNADERAHLVPVLNIILKLSPDECKHLQAVAKGGENSGQLSWSNILPMW